MIFDPLYFMMLMPAMALAIWAQFKVKSAFSQMSKVGNRRGMSGAEAAYQILVANGLEGRVGIERTHGFLGDHYDPRHKVLRLSPDVYDGRSLAAVGVAAHEVGHALQDAHRYAPLTFRNAVVPVAGFGSNASFMIFIVGMLMQWEPLMLIAIGLFSVVVIFQLVNLPVEFNASSRARQTLQELSILSPDEDRGVAKVLNAAAMTYVAATVSAIVTLLYFVIRSGLLGGNRS